MSDQVEQQGERLRADSANRAGGERRGLVAAAQIARALEGRLQIAQHDERPRGVFAEQLRELLGGDLLEVALREVLHHLLEGVAEFNDGNNDYEIAAGDMTYGPSGVPATLRFKTDSRQLFIKVPELALSQRMIAPLSLSVGYLPGHSGISHVLSGMLQSLADGLDDISAVELRPVELALTEFLITCLAHEGQLSGGDTVGNDASAVRTAHLHRICQTIETRLGDPKLNPRRIADEHGVSVRYLQKLFTQSGQTFSGYVRARRLERCRNDLSSPLYAHLSITEICYRWGFNASAHFSRAFRENFDMSPRDYRLQELGRR